MAFTEQYDVAVVGAGHAGCEAAVAASRMGLRAALFTFNLDLIAQMSCNPAIGGIAKGHLVREIDALGGVMGEVADAVGHSIPAAEYRAAGRRSGRRARSATRSSIGCRCAQVLEDEPNLRIKQAEVADWRLKDIGIEKRSRAARARRQAWGCACAMDERSGASAVVVTTGTFLNGLAHVGRDASMPAGAMARHPRTTVGDASALARACLDRLKTGTPPRLDGRTIDWSRFEPQAGDRVPTPFSFSDRTNRARADQVLSSLHN